MSGLLRPLGARAADRGVGAGADAVVEVRSRPPEGTGGRRGVPSQRRGGPRLGLLALGLSGGLACTSTAPRSEGKQDVDREAEAERRSASVTDPASATTYDSGLKPVALREGSVELIRIDGGPAILLDGEPVPFEVGKMPQRRPGWDRGLETDELWGASESDLSIFAGSVAEGTAHLAIERHFERLGSSVRVFRRDSDTWVEIESQSKTKAVRPQVVALVELPGGAVLGAITHRPNYSVLDDDVALFDPDSDAVAADLGDQLRRTSDELRLLAGELEVVPQLPRGWALFDAVATPAGTVVALAAPRLKKGWQSGVVKLLRWPAGAREPETLELPQLRARMGFGTMLYLSASGGQLFVHGYEVSEAADAKPQAYLAQGSADGASWQRVAAELLDSGEGWDERITSVTASTSGELWATILAGWTLEPATAPATLWRRPAPTKAEPTPAWEPLELPAVEVPGAKQERWIRDGYSQLWIKLAAGADELLHPVAREVLWADGVLWVVADLGVAHPTAEITEQARRSVLFASPASGEPTQLPSFVDVASERRAALRLRNIASLRPGGPGCQPVSAVLFEELGDSAEAAIAELSASREQLRGAAGALGQRRFDGLYVGALDGHRAVLVDVWADSEADAQALAKQLQEITGRKPRLDCRSWSLVRMIDPLRSDGAP